MIQIQIGRITVSNAKLVCSPYQMLLKESSSCVKSVLSVVTNCVDFDPTIGLRHSLGMEICAKLKHQPLKSKFHKRLKLKMAD